MEKNSANIVDRNHPVFKVKAEPFFDIVREGLGDEVDGDHFCGTLWQRRPYLNLRITFLDLPIG
jgi:hypothetical protein